MPAPVAPRTLRAWTATKSNGRGEEVWTSFSLRPATGHGGLVVEMLAVQKFVRLRFLGEHGSFWTVGNRESGPPSKSAVGLLKFLSEFFFVQGKISFKGGPSRLGYRTAIRYHDRWSVDYSTGVLANKPSPNFKQLLLSGGPRELP